MSHHIVAKPIRCTTFVRAFLASKLAGGGLLAAFAFAPASSAFAAMCDTPAVDCDILSNRTYTDPNTYDYTPWNSVDVEATSGTPSVTLTQTGGTVIAKQIVLYDGGYYNMSGGTVNDSGDFLVSNWSSGAANSAVSQSGGTMNVGGSLRFSHFNGNSGSYTLSGGNLNVAGNVTTGAGAVGIASGATLGGNGSVVGPATALGGGNIAPGNPLGALTFAAGLNLNSGAVLDLALGTNSDLVRVSGGTFASASSVTINLADSGGFGYGNYTLVDFTGATASGIDASNFTLGTTPAGYSCSLSIQGTTLVLNVKKAPTITWNAPAGSVYGTPLSSTQLNATASYGGNPVAGTFVYTPTAGTVLSAGANQMLSVNFLPTDGTQFGSASAATAITVTQAALTITADNKSRAYGASDPSFTWTPSGFVNGDTSSSLTTQPGLVTTATPTSSVGNYAITPSGAASPNYAISYVSGTLTIVPATTTTTLASACMLAFVAPQPYTYSATVSGSNPAGSVTFSDRQGGTLCNAVPLSNGTASCTTSALGFYPDLTDG